LPPGAAFWGGGFRGAAGGGAHARAHPGSDYEGTAVTITGDGGITLHVESLYSDPGRVEISGVYPSTRMERLARTTITVAASRGPKVIAREITSRLLPGYLTELARVVEFNVRQAHDTGLREALAGKLTGMFPGAFTRTTGWTLQGTEVVIPCDSGPSDGGTAGLSTGAATVHLDLRGVPQAVALRMLEILAAG
jgi:hypothetical protein